MCDGMRDLAVVAEAEARVSDALIRVNKPWGHELIWAKTDRYVGKILHIEAGHVLSLQYHNVKDETIYVLTGEIILRLGQGETLSERRMRVGENPPSRRKRIRNFKASSTTICSRGPRR